jgi:hypothetical protein
MEYISDWFWWFFITPWAFYSEASTFWEYCFAAGLFIPHLFMFLVTTILSIVLSITAIVISMILVVGMAVCVKGIFFGRKN